MTFIVEVLNKHFEPKSQVRRIGEYDTKKEAIAAANSTIEESLRREFKPGMNAETLFSLYQKKGEYPVIFRDDDNTINVHGFSHILCAMACAQKICGGNT